MADLAIASNDEFVIRCFVHLVARKDGAFSLNRLFTHLLAHLALYRDAQAFRRFQCFWKERHPLSTVWVCTSSIPKDDWFGLKLRQPSSQSKTIIESRDKVSKVELATLTYISWQDGSVIRKGKIPLIGLLVWFSKESHRAPYRSTTPNCR